MVRNLGLGVTEDDDDFQPDVPAVCPISSTRWKSNICTFPSFVQFLQSYDECQGLWVSEIQRASLIGCSLLNKYMDMCSLRFCRESHHEFHGDPFLSFLMFDVANIWWYFLKACNQLAQGKHGAGICHHPCNEFPVCRLHMLMCAGKTNICEEGRNNIIEDKLFDDKHQFFHSLCLKSGTFPETIS